MTSARLDSIGSFGSAAGGPSFGLLRPAGKGLVASDEAGAAREGEVGPSPVGQHGKPIAEADEKEDVDRDPYEPSGEATHMGLEGPLDFGDGGHAADGGHVAFVKVAEGWAALAGEVGGDHSGDVVTHLEGGLGHAWDLVTVLLEMSEVAEHEDVGQAERVEVIIDYDAAAAVERDIWRRGQHLAEWRGLDACCPQGDGGVDALSVGFNPSRAYSGDLRFGVHFDAQMLERSLRFGGEVRRIRGEHARAAVKQENAAFGWVDVAKVVAHVKLGDVANGAGQLDAGGPAANDDEVEGRVPALLEHLALGELEGQQDTAANLDRVFNGLEARCEGLPLVVTEVGVGGSGSEGEVVIVETRSAGQLDAARGGVDCDDFIHQHFSVALVAQDGADGLSDVGRRKHCQRDLIEQRLKGVVIAAIDYGDVDRQACEPFCSVKAGKARADDDHSRPTSRRRVDGCGCGCGLIVVRRFGHCIPPPEIRFPPFYLKDARTLAKVAANDCGLRRRAGLPVLIRGFAPKL